MVLVGNTLPAINDVTADELVSVIDDVAQFCSTIQVSNHHHLHPTCINKIRLPETQETLEFAHSKNNI